MTQAKSGDTVKIHYKGCLEDGTIFDSTEGKDPFEHQLGTGNAIIGFDNMIIGMNVGETKKETITHENAYGPYRDELKVQVNKAEFPENIEVKEGMQLMLQNDENGQNLPAVIVAVEKDIVTLDMNFPLAGKNLTFEVTLVEVVDQSA